MFSDVLLTTDYDRTFTAPDSSIPERNLEAVAWFMEHGGAFTVNTGRSLHLARKIADTVPMNAPMLLFNGSVAYENGQVLYHHDIGLPLWETVMTLAEKFPELNVEIQNLDGHFLIDPEPAFEQLYRNMGWSYSVAQPGTPMGPLIKIAVYGPIRQPLLADVYEATPEDRVRFDEIAEFMKSQWGEQLEVCFAAPRILDAQPKGTNKGLAARQLQQELGRKLLVCIGDGENDIAMLDAADHAFCPADAIVARRYETVCNCADGAVADVIYKKIPEILNIQP